MALAAVGLAIWDEQSAAKGVVLACTPTRLLALCSAGSVLAHNDGRSKFAASRREQRLSFTFSTCVFFLLLANLFNKNLSIYIYHCHLGNV